jgi:hypothetical protein
VFESKPNLEHLPGFIILREAFAILGGKPPRWLGIAMRAPKLVVSHGKFVLPFCDLVKTLKLDLCGSLEKR